MLPLGYIPFVHPIQFFHEWWFVLIVPLALGVSIVYKAVRMPSLAHFWRAVLVMTIQIVLGMIGLAILVTIIVLWIPHMHMR